MSAIFTTVSEDWVRKPYFDYFYYTIKTKYNINHQIDITALIAEIKDRKLKFYPTFLYVIMRVVNQNEEFRMSFDERGSLGTWNYVVPSYTIFHDDDKTFSDIWSEYKPGFNDFYETVTEDLLLYKDVKGIKAKQDRPQNFCPISVLPWLSFSGFSQDTYTESPFLYPIIRFGKFYEQGGRTLIPFSVFVNHAIADGYHTSKLINEVQGLANDVTNWVNL
ncbi:chloramphenicol acetyltransferase CAT [Pedobacter sp. PAMC26386]|nr:chloramphenicol acetyltransferase CAT [Pedobacter sp. PAMC26386]